MNKSTVKWFGNGMGCARRYAGDTVVLFQWSGRSDGFARCEGKGFNRNGVYHASFAALLRAVAAEERA